MWIFLSGLRFLSHDSKSFFAEGKAGSSSQAWQNKDAPFTKGATP